MNTFILWIVMIVCAANKEDKNTTYYVFENQKEAVEFMAPAPDPTTTDCEAELYKADLRKVDEAHIEIPILQNGAE